MNEILGVKLVPHILQIGGAWSTYEKNTNKTTVPHILQIGGAWSWDFLLD